MVLDIHWRFKKITSRTPLYHQHDQRFYWKHCWYCGVELIYDKKLKKLKANSFTRDHVIPASVGGKNGYNTVPSCNSCNQRKKNNSLDGFRHKLLGGNKLFYGEHRELDLKKQLENRQLYWDNNIRQAVEAVVMKPPAFDYQPRRLKCYVGRELILFTGLTRILRKLFY